ncbi:FAD-dependent oxidoreductase [Gloeobacter morelensis]|uniref:FAD-dependent oxidoreductase n=1 Tax=Gloeobacter morelensis MG652769 TaxID=2781736 RepID=A0ABY3PHR6_9CYAN|nr:FAD-dependent oxidoreductase [Gloeobacter morelensis]UFP93210.1 FAD-dependent oxidoreductase [Gloeobacter morelensis MG652769]
MEKADVIVIGSGQGGVPLAVDQARCGRKVVLFERAALGGSCINYGCTPSKALLAAAHAAGRARLAAPLGIHAEVKVDFERVMERVRSIRASFSQGIERRLTEAGVRIVRAEASFLDPQTVTGGGLQVQSPLVVINTGTGPAIPELPDLKGLPLLTNLNIFDLEKLPRCTLILGGGYIGLELGQGLARLGSEVHIVHNHDRLLNHEEPEVGEVLAEALSRDGVHLHLDCEVNEAIYQNGICALTLADGQTLRGDAALLAAAGRIPNTAALGASAAGIDLDKQGYVVIDEHFRTTAPGVYAIGDVARQPAFTHVSWEDYRRLQAILNGEQRTRSDRVLGYAVYTEPQVGRVGLTLDQALAQGHRARAVTLPMAHIARAIEWGHDLGFYRLVVDEDTDKILGATLVGYEAAEIVHVLLAHMQAGSTWKILEQSVHIHPTYGEALPSLARLLTQ